jgi:hypothetical protein
MNDLKPSPTTQVTIYARTDPTDGRISSVELTDRMGGHHAALLHDDA